MLYIQNYSLIDLPPFKVYLFGGEIRWIENFGKKIEMKFFLECVELGGEERK